MTNYRLYCFDGVGKVWVADWLEAASDEEAINAARQMDSGVKCELWEGHRLVASIDRRAPARAQRPVFGMPGMLAA